MAFDVTFYAFEKRENSTKRPTSSTSQYTYNNIELKGPCSVMEPVLLIRPGSTPPIGWNYCYIPDFSKYYWVREWTNDGPLWIASCVEDVLATFRGSIGNSTQYILRSSYSYDGDILDTLYPAKAGTVTAATVSNLYSASLSSGYYVVGIINKDALSSVGNMGCVKYYCFTAAGLREFMTKLFTDNFTQFSNNDSNLTESVYKSLFNPIEYITSCIFLPVQPLTGNAVTSLSYGYWSITGLTGCEEVSLNGNRVITGSVDIPKHPQAASRGNYLNLKPYTSYQIIVPPFGQFPIDPNAVNTVDKLYYRIIVDTITGQAILKLTLDSSWQVIIYEGVAQVGVPIALAQMSRDYMGALTSAVGGAAGALMSGLAGNAVGAIAGGLAAVGNVAQSLMPQLTTNGANGSFVSLTQDITLTAQFLPIVDEDNADLGRPLCKKAVISDYPGYLMVAEADVSPAPSTAAEQQRIKAYMENGFFYE